MWSFLKAWRRRSPFAPVEHALLQALQAYLPEEPRAILAQQIGVVNSIYRHKEIGEVNLYTPQHKPPPRFPNQRVVVLGLSEVRAVWLSSGAYYLLAEQDGGFLGVAEGEREGRVVYLHHEYSEPCATFRTFAEALEHLLIRPELP